MKRTLSIILFGAVFLLGNLGANAQNFFVLFGDGGAGLLPENETTPPVPSTGSGDIIDFLPQFDPVTNELHFYIAYGSAYEFTDLTGPATAAHIHGPADPEDPFGTDAVILFDLMSSETVFFTDQGASGGKFTGFVDLDDNLSADPDELLNNQFYINIHTAAHGDGEIRGNFVFIPEPSTYALAFSVAVLVLVGLRRCP